MEFTIMGERCSGTHYLQYGLLFNFEVNYVKTYKHFYYTNDCMEDIKKNPDRIYLCVVRDPVEWVDSFFKRLHHVPPENKKSIESFIRNPFYSIHEEGELKNKEMMEDRHLITGERYLDIFQLRKVKNDFYLKTLITLSKNVMIIKYEDIRDDYEKTLDQIANRFHLKKKNETYRPVTQYKGTYIAKYVKKPILLSNEIKKEIWEKVDKEQELEIGYSKMEIE